MCLEWKVYKQDPEKGGTPILGKRIPLDAEYQTGNTMEPIVIYKPIPDSVLGSITAVSLSYSAPNLGVVATQGITSTYTIIDAPQSATSVSITLLDKTGDGIFDCNTLDEYKLPGGAFLPWKGDCSIKINGATIKLVKVSPSENKLFEKKELTITFSFPGSTTGSYESEIYVVLELKTPRILPGSSINNPISSGSCEDPMSLGEGGGQTKVARRVTIQKVRKDGENKDSCTISPIIKNLEACSCNGLVKDCGGTEPLGQYCYTDAKSNSPTCHKEANKDAIKDYFGSAILVYNAKGY